MKNFEKNFVKQNKKHTRSYKANMLYRQESKRAEKEIRAYLYR